jgi:hypothetical protein
MGVDPALAEAILGGGCLLLGLGTSEGNTVLHGIALALGPCFCFAGATKIYQLSSQLSTGGSSNV